MEEPEFDETVDAIHHERPMRIICIGAGASGLCFAYKLQRSFRNFSLTVRVPCFRSHSMRLSFYH